MRPLIKLFNIFGKELMVIIVMLFVINNFLKYETYTIKSDGVGHYDYLPSLFIHNDLLRKDNPMAESPDLYKRIESIYAYKEYKGYSVNRYPAGTALLQSPFFLTAYFIKKSDGDVGDGYEPIYHRYIFYATLFYLFLSLFFLKRLLQEYEVNNLVILICQLGVALATPALHYTYFESSYGHVYSLFAITAFLYFFKSYSKTLATKSLIWSIVFFALILFIRQVNCLIVFFIPFLCGSPVHLKKVIINLFKPLKKGLLAGVLLFILLLLQPLMWYLQSGNWVLYSYTDEGFNFWDPQLYALLFSYQKGLFVYTPIFLIGLLASFEWLFKKMYYSFFTYLAFFLLITYVFSSWWAWYYGCSFGQRVFVEFSAVFFIPIALFLKNSVKKIRYVVIIVLTVIAAYVNVIQTYQYKSYILHWMLTDEESYWKIFLRTEDQFKGIAWKLHPDMTKLELTDEKMLGDATISKNEGIVLARIPTTDIKGFDEIKYMKLLIENDYQEDLRVKLSVSIDDSSKNYFYAEHFILKFLTEDYGQWQMGEFIFPLEEKVQADSSKTFRISLFYAQQTRELKNMKIQFFKEKQP